MGRLCLGLFALLVASCGGSAAPEQSLEFPELLRSCGEVDARPAESPTLLGDDLYGCPLFEPAPCTEALVYYDELCGDDCTAGTATSSTGDEWFVGCVRSFLACADIDSPPSTFCHDDPEGGVQLWYSFNCGPVYQELLCNWPLCHDGEVFAYDCP
ncbi:MAG: hypothetical protein WBG86_20195 [Polyangiales bacterium]